MENKPDTRKYRGKHAGIARKAIAEFVESNIPRFNGWLEQIAGGIPQYDQHGIIQVDAKGCPIWLVKPDPATAMKLVGDLTEYHLPKLSRADVAVAAKVESVTSIEGMSNRELSIALAAALGVGQVPEQPEVIDAEFVMVEQGQQQEAALPDWLKPTPPESVR